jgi:hypothetical protein
VSFGAYLFTVVVAVAVLGGIVELLRRRRLRERHAVWWIVAGLVALVLAVFPWLLVELSTLLGINVPTNLGFFLAIILLFLVSVAQSGELTQLESKTRVLAENVALLEERIVRLEAGGRGPNPSADAHPPTSEIRLPRFGDDGADR